MDFITKLKAIRLSSSFRFGDVILVLRVSKQSRVLYVQLSFQVWTKQMQDMLNSRKRGDMAFREKDFRTAIDCYTQV